MGVVMYKVLLKVSRSCHSMHDLRSVARGRKVHSHNVPAVFSGFPNVRTRSLLSSCAVKRLTHLSPHCSTDTDTHIKKHRLTSGFGETPLPWITVTVYVEWTATPPPPPSPSAAFIRFGLYSLQSAVPESVRTFSEERAGKLRYGLRQGETEGRCRGQSRREKGEGAGGWVQGGCRLFWNRCAFDKWGSAFPGSLLGIDEYELNW